MVGEETYDASHLVTSLHACVDDSLDVMMPSVGVRDVEPDDERCDDVDDQYLDTLGEGKSLR
jgi:hypothetical protein